MNISVSFSELEDTRIRCVRRVAKKGKIARVLPYLAFSTDEIHTAEPQPKSWLRAELVC